MSTALLVVLVGLGAAALWQLVTIRRAQVELGLQLVALAGLLDGRTVKIAQDVAALQQLWKDDDAAPE